MVNYIMDINKPIDLYGNYFVVEVLRLYPGLLTRLPTFRSG